MKGLFHLIFGITIDLLYFIHVDGSIYENLKHFEIIHADEVQHKITKRGLKESNHPFNHIREVNLKTHGRDLRLIVSPKKDILHSNFKAFSVDGDGKETTVHIDHNDFYHGRVFGETNSHVSLHMEDGLMTGSIHLPDETFHVEPSWRHLPHSNNRSMITYKQSDVKFSWEQGDSPKDHRTHKICDYIKEGAELETDDYDDEEVSKWTSDRHREKRQIIQDEYTPTKTRCPLLLVADYRFFQEMGGSNTKTTINYLISLIDRVHKIYNDTSWQDRQEEGFKGMGFVIKKIVVHSDPTRIKSGEAHYNMIREKWDVRNLLEAFSREPGHGDFCLAHLFTHQTFRSSDSVVLGLAYIASPRLNTRGGVCSKEYFKNGYTLYLNSGLSSSRNHYGQRVITREADLVTAHEFGHNWGSEHDPDIPECSPTASQGGSYLMYTYSVSGYDVNNKRFSPCSLRSIKKVLQAKSGRCFSEPEESFCGNLRVEGDEECDAGLLGTEDNDVCCDKDCKLRPKAACSDKNSPCCQHCQFMRSGVKCREAQYATCEQESRCTGQQAECPKSPPMADGTDCQERGKCGAGKCVPFCETQAMQSCMCDVIEDACKRCCRSNINETCSPVDSADILADGTPCIQGFCNNVLQIGFVVTAILDETFNLLKLPKGIRHRLGTVRSFVFHSLLFPSTLLVMTFFWSLWHFDRSLIFPEVLDDFFPTWLNHALHTFIAVPLVIELCLSTRREFKEEGRAAIVLLGYMTVYTTLFLSLYFRYGIWLYPIYKFLTWPQKAVLCVVKFTAVLVFQRIGVSLMSSKRVTTDHTQKVQ